jgi:hypothetical protein
MQMRAVEPLLVLRGCSQDVMLPRVETTPAFHALRVIYPFASISLTRTTPVHDKLPVTPCCCNHELPLRLMSTITDVQNIVIGRVCLGVHPQPRGCKIYATHACTAHTILFKYVSSGESLLTRVSGDYQDSFWIFRVHALHVQYRNILRCSPLHGEVANKHYLIRYAGTLSTAQDSLHSWLALSFRHHLCQYHTPNNARPSGTIKPENLRT